MHTELTPARVCEWCLAPLDPYAHARRRYCPDSYCRQAAHVRRLRDAKARLEALLQAKEMTAPNES